MHVNGSFDLFLTPMVILIKFDNPQYRHFSSSVLLMRHETSKIDGIQPPEYITDFQPEMHSTEYQDDSHAGFCLANSVNRFLLPPARQFNSIKGSNLIEIQQPRSFSRV